MLGRVEDEGLPNREGALPLLLPFCPGRVFSPGFRAISKESVVNTMESEI